MLFDAASVMRLTFLTDELTESSNNAHSIILNRSGLSIALMSQLEPCRSKMNSFCKPICDYFVLACFELIPVSLAHLRSSPLF
jgi:hypothetical protein